MCARALDNLHRSEFDLSQWSDGGGGGKKRVCAIDIEWNWPRLGLAKFRQHNDEDDDLFASLPPAGRPASQPASQPASRPRARSLCKEMMQTRGQK